MQRKKKVCAKTFHRHSKNLTDSSNNLSGNISASFSDKSGFARTVSKTHFPKKSLSTVKMEYERIVPANAAVHFGQFYGLRENARQKLSINQVDGSRKVDTAPIPLPRREFTRQMVHKLERLNGTLDYTRQVSDLLEETVEPADFKVNLPPAENTIPDGRQNPSGIPLWYKEPYKPSLSLNHSEILHKERLNTDRKGFISVFEDDVRCENYEGDERSYSRSRKTSAENISAL